MNKIIKNLTNVNLQVLNILAIYNQASENEVINGTKWYRDANNMTKLMAEKYNLTHIQTAGIVASLSPGTNWNQNIIDANHLCSYLKAGLKLNNVTVTTYGQNKDKAYKIYLNPQITGAECFKLILGASVRVNKTSSFFLNILHPDQSDIVTIDRHSFRVNLGLTELPQIALTEKRYRIMTEAYKKASKKIQINPIDLQAITWLTFRRLNVTVPKTEITPF
jgi:hypothetical protein